MVQQVEVPQVEFLARVAKLPVVSSAIEYATDTYDKAKCSSPNLIRRTLSTAEDTVKYAAKRAIVPVVNTFERPIHAVDSLACKTLDKVEESLPMMKKTPDEIINSTKSYVNEKWQPVHNQVESAYSFVSSATNSVLDNPIGRFALGSIESALSICNSYIDYFVPPLEGEKPHDAVPAQPSQQLVHSAQQTFGMLSNVQKRVSFRVMNSLREFGLDGLAMTGSLVNLLEWIVNSGNDTMNYLPNRFHELADFYRSQDEGNKNPEATPMEDAIFLATHLTNRLIESGENALKSLASLPAGTYGMFKTQFNQILGPARDFTSSLIHVATPGDLVDRAQTFLNDLLSMMSKHLPLSTAKGSDDKGNQGEVELEEEPTRTEEGFNENIPVIKTEPEERKTEPEEKETEPAAKGKGKKRRNKNKNKNHEDESRLQSEQRGHEMELTDELDLIKEFQGSSNLGEAEEHQHGHAIVEDEFM